MRLGWESRTRRQTRVDFDDAIAQLDRALSADERARHFALTGSWRLPKEPAPPELPPLEHVTGWSRAEPAKPRHTSLALFGGWRIGEMKRKRRSGR